MIVRAARAAFFILLLVSATSHAALFEVNRTIGAGSVLGTITTDDTVGVLSAANFVSWSLTIDEGDAEGSLLLTPANSDVDIQGDSLTATLTELLFNFSGVGDYALWQNPSLGSGINFWCADNTGFSCSNQGDSVETVHREGAFFSGQLAVRSGIVALGEVAAVTAVPEPGSLALLGVALGAFGLSRRRKRIAAA